MADMYHVYGQPATGYAGPWRPGYGGYVHGRDGRYESPYARGYGVIICRFSASFLAQSRTPMKITKRTRQKVAAWIPPHL